MEIISSILILVRTIDDQCTTIGLDSFTDCLNQQHSNLVTSRRRTNKSSSESHNSEMYTASQQAINQASQLSQWKRIMLLVIDICTFIDALQSTRKTSKKLFFLSNHK